MTRPIRRLAGLLAATFMALGLILVPASQARAQTLYDYALIITVADPDTGETVAIDADVRILLRHRGDDTLIRASITRATATGVTTGDRYILSGSDQAIVPTSRLNEPVVLTFQLKPPGERRRADVSAAFFLSIE